MFYSIELSHNECHMSHVDQAMKNLNKLSTDDQTFLWVVFQGRTQAVPVSKYTCTWIMYMAQIKVNSPPPLFRASNFKCVSISGIHHVSLWKFVVGGGVGG